MKWLSSPWKAVLLLAPTVIVFTVLIVWPVLYSLGYSFTDFTGFGTPKWVGGRNYAALFGDAFFWSSLRNTLIILVVSIVVLVPGMLVWASAGDSEAWLVGTTTDSRLTEISPRLGSGREAPKAGTRGGLAERLVVGTDGLFRHAPEGEILRLVRAEQLVKPGWADRFHDAMKKKKAEKKG